MRRDKIEELRLAKTLSAYGLQQSITQELTSATNKFIAECFKPPEHKFRKGDTWLQEKGGPKTVADRILRFLKNCHGDDLSSLTLQAENLLELYEAFMIQHPRQIMSINRFYYFSLELIANNYPVMKCKCCKKPYMTENARIVKCGICYDIEKREQHMIGVRKRRAEMGDNVKSPAPLRKFG
ncbi:MAG: hypothetical protein ACI9T7_000026 [Oleiphilaceae bacterium]|jgi:hypothetical protein